MSPLRVGVQLPEVERHVTWRETLAMALTAEEVGFDSVWLGDHLLYRDTERGARGPWDSWTTLAALAAQTERVRLGPLVACAAFHPPGILARMAASIDEISGERFVLGIGAGWGEVEFRSFGIPFDQRASRFEEALEIIGGLLGGETVTSHGRFHHVEEAVLLPVPSRRVPIMLGSNGERLLRAGLPLADAWNTWFDAYGNTPEGFARLNERISSVASEVGRDPADIARSACVLVVLDGGSGERGYEGVPPIQGDAASIGDHLERLHDAGADEVILVVDPITEGSIRELGDVLGLPH